MAEALGVGASVVGIISLTIQITQVAVQFGLDWKKAPQEVKAFKIELDSLYVVLSETQTRLFTNPEYEAAFQDGSALLAQLGPNAPSTTALKQNLASCKAQLDEMTKALSKMEAGHRLGWERFKRPFLSDSCQKTMSTLRSQCQIFNTLSSIDNNVLTAQAVTETKAMRREQQVWIKSEEDERILQWLSSFDVAEKHVDILSRRHPGTGQWLLERDEFKDWRDRCSGSPPFMWLPGIPGAGKSVMAGIIVEHLQGLPTKGNVGVAFIYCDYKDRINQTDTNLFSSLLKQFILQLGYIPHNIGSLHNSGNKNSLTLEDCVRLLPTCSRLFDRSFIVIDALDEHLTEPNYTPQIQLLAKLSEVQANDGKCRILITSRTVPTIESQLSNAGRIEVNAHNDDIAAYLRSRLFDASKFPFADKMSKDLDLANRITTTLVEKAKGMFLLPRLHLDLLGNQTRISKMVKALDTLPSALNETYDNAMTRIKGQVPEHRDLAMKVLSWISNTVRPLGISELQHALGTEPGDPELDDEDPETEELLLSVCGGLVIVDDESRVIRLVHFTVEEFFSSMKSVWFPSGDEEIAITCLTYLTLSEFEKRAKSDADLHVRLERYHLYDYAAQYWVTHFPKSPKAESQQILLDFLNDRPKVSSSCQTFLRAAAQSQTSSWCYFTNPHGLHLAAHFCRSDIVSRLLEDGADPNSIDKIGRNALVWAAYRGDIDTVKRLADAGANIDPELYAHSSALIGAVQGGHEKVVELLLERGANVNVSVDEMTPLLAARKGSPAIFDKLLGYGANVNALDRRGRSLLFLECETVPSVAAGLESGRISRLLELGADVECKAPGGLGTPLLYAISTLDQRLVDLLLKYKANVLAKDSDGRLALACRKDSKDFPEGIVTSLLEAAVNQGRKYYAERVLLQACSAGDKSLIEILLNRGVDANIGDSKGNTPLIVAAAFDYSEIIELLLARAQLPIDGGRGMAPLCVPVGLQHTVPEGYNDRRTALSIAAQSGHMKTVKLLVDKGARIDAEDQHGKTALWWAGFAARHTVVQFFNSCDRSPSPELSPITPTLDPMEIDT